MKINLFLLFFLVVSGAIAGIGVPFCGRGELWAGGKIVGLEGKWVQGKPAFDRKEYYRILKGGELGELNRELETTGGLTGNDGDAYTGTLLMRKAGKLKRPKEKLEAFKRGRIKLETAIRADPGRVEYHFLRLMIQEHAPSAVKYRDELDADRDLVRRRFAGLPADLQEAIRDYSRSSAVLHPADL